ncbi:hypothetical protein CYMTET_48369 [Cymbomonas tetramitiformis]|uniref:Uncharacterized protein n=1 Tax=Cymbomonas tetramitiformis TaxID=36881 RepID=A0AAE0EV86_9CHLO|nr:hypothetical protein CYMTET_48369 [Cymbomonas tetramitiformis]
MASSLISVKPVFRSGSLRQTKCKRPSQARSSTVVRCAEIQDKLGFANGGELVNGRTAMVAFLGIAATEITTGQTVMQQLESAPIPALAVSLLVTAASLAPIVNEKVTADNLFPTSQDAYPDSLLPTTWTYDAEVVNGRAAMVGLLAMIGYEIVKGTPNL